MAASLWFTSRLFKWDPKRFFFELRVLAKETPYHPLFSFWLRIFLVKFLKTAENNGLFKDFQVGSDKVNVSHLQFADDTLILIKGEEYKVPILKSLSNVLSLYQDSR